MQIKSKKSLNTLKYLYPTIMLFRPSKSIKINFFNYSFSFALGKYSNKFFDYWASPCPHIFKLTLSTKFFWACLMRETRINKG